MSTVLVTGGSGFLAGHCIVQLLGSGHRVRTTLRSPQRAGDVLAMLRRGGVEPGDSLQFHAADLTNDTGWPQAAAGCDYVLHLASPFPVTPPRHEDELIVPAREGTLRVLKAARDAGVKRVVLTSSFAAIGYGHAPQSQPFDERVWTDVNAPIAAYHKSKTLAERAAWTFIDTEANGLELAVVNPVGIFGPVLGGSLSSSVRIVKNMLEGSFRHCPNLYFGVVDVRDVADLHLRAMIDPAAKGQRFIGAAGDCITFFDVARFLRSGLGKLAAKAPRHELPNWQLRLAALFSSQARQMLPELGKVRHLSNHKARTMLGWSPRSDQEAIVSTAESLIRLGLVGGVARTPVA